MNVTQFQFAMRFGLSALGALAVSACAPQVEKREFTPARQEFETRNSDTDLGLGGGGVKSSTVSAAQLSWNGDDVNTGEIFRTAERLLVLGRRFNKPGMEQAGERLAQAFYKGAGTTSVVSFEDSLYISAAVGETQESISGYLDEIRKTLVNERVVVGQVLETSVTQYPWPRGHLSVRDLLLQAEAYLAWWLARLEQLGVDPRILREIKTAASEEFGKESTRARGLFQRILDARTLTETVKQVKHLVTELELELETQSLAELNRGALIGAALDDMKSAQDALSLIVEFWGMLSVEERKGRFNGISEELFGYLSARSSSDLECLKKENCMNVVITLHKQLKLLPALREFGIDKLRAQMDEAARVYAIHEVETRAGAFLPELPGLIKERVDKEFAHNLQWVTSIRSDIKGFIRKMAQRWSREKLVPDGFAFFGVESGKASLRLQGGFQIKGGKSFETGAEALGSSLALAATRLSAKTVEGEATQPEILRLAVAQLNKMLALGGFRTAEKKLYKSYAIALDPKAPSAAHVNLRAFMGAPFSYAVLDRFHLNGPFDAVLPALKDRSVSVRGQAELLRGLSGMIRYLRDWEPNGFDKSLGKVKVADYLQDVPADDITEVLFPKDMMFALAVGNAAVILQNMAKTLTPVFLMNLEKQSSWASDFDFSKGNSATMAALVDIKGGVRQDIVRTEDIARYALAVIEFLDAVEGIEKTKAPPLVDRDKDGKRTFEQLLAAREDLRYLLIGISNFLARQMQGASGGFRSEFDKAKGQAQGSYRLLDQALAIQVMVRASEMFQVRVYGSVALESYYFMNKSLWNPKAQFYKKDDSAGAMPTPDEALTVLETIENLSPLMPSASRAQWERLSRAWLMGFESL